MNGWSRQVAAVIVQKVPSYEVLIRSIDYCAFQNLCSFIPSVHRLHASLFMRR
jgi:hypothetical protein